MYSSNNHDGIHAIHVTTVCRLLHCALHCIVIQMANERIERSEATNLRLQSQLQVRTVTHMVSHFIAFIGNCVHALHVRACRAGRKREV